MERKRLFCCDDDWQDQPNALAYWCAGVLLFGVVLLGWLLVQSVSGWLVRLRG